MDRLLAPDKRTIRRRLYGRTKPGTLLKHHIPVKTDHWDVTEPGFTEVDLVSHSGDRADGDFLHTLNLTDIHTTWVEHGAVLGKSQVRVQERLAELRAALPFALRGIDSDNGSEFINAHLLAYCRAHDIQFTRGRPYKKDDNAHIEQKNWTHVRKLMGYVRSGSTAVSGSAATNLARRARAGHKATSRGPLPGLVRVWLWRPCGRRRDVFRRLRLSSHLCCGFCARGSCLSVVLLETAMFVLAARAATTGLVAARSSTGL